MPAAYQTGLIRYRQKRAWRVRPFAKRAERRHMKVSLRLSTKRLNRAREATA